MQNEQVYHVNRRENNNNKMIKCSAIGLFVLSLILSIVLVVSIALVFTIGPKVSQRLINTESSVKALSEPCRCGCPSIEPIFNKQKKVSSRIINGETARAHSWPWQMVLLVIDINQIPISFCGATLITDRHVLTAAHCVHQYVPPFIYLFPGQDIFNFSTPLTSAYIVQKVYIHEGYNVLLHDDIAILTIGQALRFDSYIHPICLATPNSPLLKHEEELIAIGWGRMSNTPGTKYYAQNLQQVNLTYVSTSNPNCSEIYRPIANVHPGQMCAGKVGFNACQGDSGGPLMRRIRLSNTDNYYWEQIGIASKTIDCGWNSTRPDIYINIPYYYNWIMETIKRSL